jgi:DNA-binding CsgD family transcriptional regulator
VTGAVMTDKGDNEFPNRLEGDLSDLCKRYGFDRYMLAAFPRADKSGFRDNIVHSNWPTGLVNSYSISDAFRSSRLIATLKRQVAPVLMAGSSFWQDENGRDLADLDKEFARFGYASVLACSLHDAHMNIYVLALSGDNVDTTQVDKAALYFEAVEIVDRASGDSLLQAGPREKLTAREIECLRWSAAGKSSEEIAIILSISSHTVISYLKSAMRKLEAVNRMQAVARAYRYRLL